MFSPGNQTVIHDQEYQDNHTRTFTGYPEMNDEIKKMLTFWKKGRKYKKILIFFIEKCGFDGEYSGFLLRELIRGKI